MKGVLSNIRVLDLSRHLAGPWASQIMADMGAEVIKVERPRVGDDSRAFGWIYLKDKDGRETKENPFFLAANRGKKSVTLDLAKPEGQDIVRRLAAVSDVVIENYRVGALQRYGLGYEDLKRVKPDIIYCSITGFGQDGPYRDRPGYDTIFQAMGGLMSITGVPDGQPGAGPAKTGTSVSDLMTGMYSCIGILGAINHRRDTGQGQHIDMALLDSQVAAVSIEAARYLLLGQIPKRLGDVSPNTVPTQNFHCQDGTLVLAVGNDGQFAKLMELMGRPEIARDERFAKTVARNRNRDALIPVLEQIFLTRPVREWVDTLAPAGVPCGPVNDMQQVFEDEQVRYRRMCVEVEHASLGKVPAVANPIKYSATPIKYDVSSPSLGQHTREVLRDYAQVAEADIDELSRKGII